MRDQMGQKLDRQREYYDKKIHGQSYKQGDLVWLHSPVVPRGRAKKLHRPWSGPFKVVRRISDATYCIQDVQRGRHRLVVHFDRLKRCPPDICIPHLLSQSRMPKSSIPTDAINPPGTHMHLEPQQDGDHLAPDLPPPQYPRRDRHPPSYLYRTITHLL